MSQPHAEVRETWLDRLKTGDVVGVYEGHTWKEGLPFLHTATVKRAGKYAVFLLEHYGRLDWKEGSRNMGRGEFRIIGPVPETTP